MGDIPAHLYDLDGSSDHANRVQADYVKRSEVAKGLSGAMLDLFYGREERQRLDVFPAGPDAPVLVFFHGGYWRAGSKDSRRFPAIPWCERRVSWVAVNYRLVPGNRLEDAVEDARAALVWLAENAEGLGLNGEALHVCGNSAGGHLAAMVVAAGWAGRPSIRSATVVSGLFDLTPLRAAAANDWLGLDAARAKALSPIALPPPPDLPVLVAVGGAETEAFKHQSRVYADMLSAQGSPVTRMETENEDHFEIIGGFGAPGSTLFKGVEGLLGR